MSKSNSQASSLRVFQSVLLNQEDITTDVYSDPLDYQTKKVIQLFQNASTYEGALRQEIEKCICAPEDWRGSGKEILCSLPEWFDFYEDQYLDTKDDLFAIDATDSPLISLMVGQFYEVVVGGCGYADGNISPQVFRASTALTAISSPNMGGSLSDLINSFQSSSDRSWPNTYREYKEREYAKDCDSQNVIVDGPILTQNLVTQKEGEVLIADIAASGKRVLGVIKDLSASTDHERWIGRVLKEEEAFVLMDCKDLLSIRNSAWGKSQSKAGWLNNVASQYCRGVYRPGNAETGKSSYFGFECKIKHLPWALAVLYKERSSIPGHEIPFLLDYIDAALDSLHDRGSVQRRLEAALMEYDPAQAFDQLNTNDFRGK